MAAAIGVPLALGLGMVLGWLLRGRARRAASTDPVDEAGAPGSLLPPRQASQPEVLEHLVRQLAERRRSEAELERTCAQLGFAQEKLEYDLHVCRQELEDARAAVLESDERFRALAEHGFDAIIETDAAGRCLWSSPNVSVILGLHPGELLRRDLLHFVHPEDRPAAAKAFKRAALSGQPVQSGFRFGGPEGPWRWLECNGKTYPTAQGEIRRVLVARDVTDRKRAEIARLGLKE